MVSRYERQLGSRTNVDNRPYRETGVSLENFCHSMKASPGVLLG